MTGRRYFVDTAFVQALFSHTDQLHSRARLWAARLPAALELWTTEVVLIEIGNAFSATNRRAASHFIRQFYSTRNARVVSVTTPLLSRALALYDSRGDKSWGLADCISFVVMTDEGLTDALTADRHFTQAGFDALLRSDP